MKFGVVIFPGSNCDKDMVHVLKNVNKMDTRELWHKDSVPADFTPEDCIVLPGGFSYGDYLRPGAIAGYSPIMESVIEFANKGGKVIGICNGFQVLCETGLLPGVLMRNSNQKFICKNIDLRVESTESPLTAELNEGDVLSIPIAHADGRYHADADTLAKLNDNKQVLFRYCDSSGDTSNANNPNGSAEGIAGICNEGRNVFGMMPHPERASEEILANTDGQRLFSSLIKASQTELA